MFFAWFAVAVVVVGLLTWMGAAISRRMPGDIASHWACVVVAEIAPASQALPMRGEIETPPRHGNA